MEWGISKSSGIIQLTKLLPIDLIYAEYHYEAVGGIWKRHHEKFSKFLLSYANDEIVEMGGGKVSWHKYAWLLTPICLGRLLSPAPRYLPTKNIKLEKGFIENSLDVISRSNTFVHIHVLEHLYEPLKILKKISSAQNKGRRMIFSIPNLISTWKINFLML